MSPGVSSFDDLRRATDQSRTGQTASFDEFFDAVSQHIPLSFTWPDLARELAQPDDVNKPQRVRALRACLAVEPSRLRDDDEEVGKGGASAAARRRIRRFVARVLTPLVEEGDDDDDDHHNDDANDDSRRGHVIRRCRSVAEDGLVVLQRVGLAAPAPAADRHGSEDNDDDDDDASQILCTVIALADNAGPLRTAAATAAAAAELVATTFAKSGESLQLAWIADFVLGRYLRPLFARSRPATVTASGRRAAYAGNNSSNQRDVADRETRATKPWKYDDLRAVSVFAWAVKESDELLVRNHWPMFTPVLLTLIDDPDTAVRARGLVLLRAFIDKVPDYRNILHNTGLESVLADAVFPTLLFLPRLTPEKESLQLLEPAYAALLSLAAAAAAAPVPLSAASSAGSRRGEDATRGLHHLPPKPAADLLDKILRDGIYAGYFHASEHIRIVELLVRQAGRVIETMGGVYAVKHLKDLIPMYASIMTDPFAMRYKPAVVAATDALQTTMVNCWPRMADTPWQEEIIKMLMLCWLNVQEDHGGEERRREKEDNKDLSARLVRAADTLLAIMRAADVNVAAKIGPLIAKEPRLADLFKIAGN
ncbi:hypothetical protein SPI_00540 [Niveomyces insectorum RCEF 264]|uniref:Uncharacterized protein n=1 Tax=Niveomyces insectorum RCEF 264 TaxID=1081102 RepID=A0A168A7A5_9HYPO|nr:hypothetical protein SPI_00540 [Niveomyces insectorum RCEF 264]